MPIIHEPLTRPLPDPPSQKVSGRQLFGWLIARQAQNVVIAVLTNFIWLSTIAIVPILFGIVTDTVISTGDGLGPWIGVFTGLAIVVVFLTIAREYVNRYCAYTAGFRMIQLVNRHVTTVGSGITRRSSAGEVLAGSSVDPNTAALTFTWGPTAVAAFFVTCTVAAILFAYSVIIGTIVVIGLTMHFVAVSKLLTPLQKRVEAFRTQEGKLANQMVDIVEGIRVLRAVGGENRFNQRFAMFSELLRQRGFKTAFPIALIEGLTVILPAATGIAVMWVSVLMARDGQLSAGDVVTIFGLTTFLLMPLQNIGRLFTMLPTAMTACGRIAATLDIPPGMPERTSGVNLTEGTWHDPATGIKIDSGTLTVIVGETHQVAELGDRLCGYIDSDASIDGTELRNVPTNDLRKRVLGLRNDHILFSETLRDNLDPHESHSLEQLRHYVYLAAVDDAYDSLGGFDAHIIKDGRNVSGGQRQRLRLARALAAEPDYLCAIEPTSALDAYTESLVVARVSDSRRGRTTLVASTSPLWLEQADRVIFLPSDGKAISGDHHQLRHDHPEYASMIART